MDTDIDINEAFSALEININDGFNAYDINEDYVKKQYRKMALKWHPDKNINKEYATQRFQKITQSYEYIINNLFKDHTEENKEDTEDIKENDKEEMNMYMNILSMFISSVLSGNISTIVYNLLQNILTEYKKNVVIHIFSSLDKDISKEIYLFIYKYKDTLHINDNTIIDDICDIVKDKFKDDMIFILNPSLDDLWENNVYKLYVNDKLYLVPLWHSELYFDIEDATEGEIIVLCKPTVPQNVNIDEDNNIIVNVNISFDSELRNVLDCGLLCFCVGNKVFEINASLLRMKREQTLTLKRKGISQIIEKDMYNTSHKSDVIVNICIV